MKNFFAGLLSTIASIVKDKTRDANESSLKAVDKIRNGISVSSKRVLNLAGTFSIITLALGDMTLNGISKFNLIVLAIGVVFCVAMSYIQSRK